MKGDTNYLFSKLATILQKGEILMEISAIILAGGKSSRMGTDKALLPLEGIPVIEGIISELEGVAPGIRILIAAGNKESYRYLGKDIVSDQFPSAGPLAGLHAGLSVSHTVWNLAVACDMPFANTGMFLALAKKAIEMESGPQGIEAVVPKIGGQIQPLLAAYRCSVLPGLEHELQEGRLKMTMWSGSLRTEYVDEAVLAQAAGLPIELLGFNMNQPGDYEKAQKLYRDK